MSSLFRSTSTYLYLERMRPRGTTVMIEVDVAAIDSRIRVAWFLFLF